MSFRIMLLLVLLAPIPAWGVTYDPYFEAICQVETDNGLNMVNGDCLGWAQIRPVVVEDCNRILGYRAFSLGDRLRKDKCHEMYWIMRLHYLGPRATLRQVALLWNAGCAGMKKPEPRHLRYVERCRMALEQIKERK